MSPNFSNVNEQYEDYQRRLLLHDRGTRNRHRGVSKRAGLLAKKGYDVAKAGASAAFSKVTSAFSINHDHQNNDNNNEA